jgi:hypothetical protein
MLELRSAPWDQSSISRKKQPCNEALPFVRRQLSPEAGRALEILGHAIEYLADEYAAGIEDKGPLGSADPRVAAIQILKALNRAVYYSGTEVEPAFRRMRRWLLGTRTVGSRAG